MPGQHSAEFCERLVVQVLKQEPGDWVDNEGWAVTYWVHEEKEVGIAILREDNMIVKAKCQRVIW